METGPKSKFMIFFASQPTESCCLCFSPKTAVYILGALDALGSLFMLCNMISAIANGYAWGEGDITLCALPFAICGITGASKGDINKLNLYSVFKQIYAMTIVVNVLLYALVMCADECSTYLFTFSIASLLEIYFAYVVWSAKEKIVMDFGSYTGFGRPTAELTPSGSSFPVVYAPPMQGGGSSKFMEN